MADRNRPVQLGLFDASRRRSLEHAHAAFEAVAEALPDALRFGTSSWSFPGWEGIVYSERRSAADLARRGLREYAAHPLLRAVGIDRTFYAPVPAEALARDAASVPDAFRFLVKAAATCTSPYERDRGRSYRKNARFLDAGFATEHVVRPFVEGLGGKAGPLVFQFPPLGAATGRSPGAFAERLHGFLAALPRGPWYAVEIRNRELLTDAYAAALRDSGATHCVSIHPRMPSARRQLRAARADDGRLAVRWMLHAGLEYEQAKERYAPFDRLVDEDPDTREALADLCLERALRGHDVVVIANNKAEGSAPLSVFALAKAVASKVRSAG